MRDEDDKPDFSECAGCGGEFYKGDLVNEYCEDCREQAGDL